MTLQRRAVTLWLAPAELVILVLYLLMLAIFGPLHEPWSDEAQAWMLAASPTLRDLLFHFLRHEGHPALWYLLLWIPTHLHLSYSLFWVISCACALAGIWVLLRFAPFPFYVRALLPFTFFLAYQYSVVARSYVLFPLLSFLSAHLYRQRPPRPLAFAIVLALLANLSVHGTLLALVFACAYLWDLKRTGTLRPTRAFVAAAALFAASILFVAICLWPTVGALPRVSPSVNRVIDLLAIPEPSSAPAAASSQTPSPLASTPAAPSPPEAAQLAQPALSAAPVAPRGHAKLANVPVVLSYAFSTWWPLAVLFEALALFYLVRQRAYLLALAPVVLALFLALVYSAPWHLGLLWIAFIAVLWAAWNPQPSRPALQHAVALYLAALCLLQLPWTYHAFRFDAVHATAPDKATAAFVKTLPPGSRIAALGMSSGLQPYFAQNPFFNQHLRFGYFAPDPLALSPEASLAAQPDAVVTDRVFEPLVLTRPYRKAAEFCGKLFLPRSSPPPGCLSVYLRK